MKLFKEFSFEAAHKLPLVDKNHKCFNLHGHSFKVKVSLEGSLNEMGWVMDFSELKKICAPYIKELDHSYLNDIKGLENPTSENLCIYIWTEIKTSLPNIFEIEIKETKLTGCIYRGGKE